MRTVDSVENSNISPVDTYVDLNIENIEWWTKMKLHCVSIEAFQHSAAPQLFVKCEKGGLGMMACTLSLY